MNASVASRKPRPGVLVRAMIHANVVAIARPSNARGAAIVIVFRNTRKVLGSLMTVIRLLRVSEPALPGGPSFKAP